MREKIYHLKHSQSCLSDVTFDVAIDDDERLVRVAAPHFDSALLAWLVATILPAEFQVVAFRDDSKPKGGELWQTPAARYRLQVAFGGSEYPAQVVRLHDGREVAVTLGARP